MALDGFIKLARTDRVMTLIARNPLAFVLLTVIAYRARRTKEPILQLDVGEAFIGDFESYGISEQNYRTAKNVLQSSGIVTCRVTPKGTIAKIVDISIYDINATDGNGQPNTQVTPSQRTANGQPTTNKNERMKNERMKEDFIRAKKDFSLTKKIGPQESMDTQTILTALEQGTESEPMFHALTTYIMQETKASTQTAQDTLRAFASYWLEQDQRGKELWRKQKTFEVKRRLARWIHNAVAYGKLSAEPVYKDPF